MEDRKYEIYKTAVTVAAGILGVLVLISLSMDIWGWWIL